MLQKSSDSDHTGALDGPNKPASVPDRFQEENYQRFVKRAKSILGHDVLGMLNVLRHSIVTASPDASDSFTTALELYCLEERLQSFLDLYDFRQLKKRDQTYLFPFELKHFIDRFIAGLNKSLGPLPGSVTITNEITEPKSMVSGSASLFEKVLRKILLTVFERRLRGGHSVRTLFKTSASRNMHHLIMICDTIHHDVDEATITSYFYDRSYENPRFSIDYLACGYLLSTQNSRIEIHCDPATNTTLHHFSLPLVD
jgi:hypothetical protein